MSNPMLQAFFVGRALAAAISERAEHLVSDGLSQLGQFDAQQRENLRQFTEEVMARAEQEQTKAGTPSSGIDSNQQSAAQTATANTGDLQATIDDLRAEVAQVRAEIQQYRQSS